MRTALERHAALLVLGAGAGLAGVSVLFSSGSSGSRLLWLGLAALVLAGVAGTALAAGWWPLLEREAVIALALLVAFVCWCGISILWSIEPDRSWEYLNRGLVYVAFAVIGLAVGSFVPRVERLWAWALAGIIALALGWALLGKAVPWIGGSGRVARLSSPVDYWNGLGLLFAIGLPLALWLAARRDHPHWLRAAGTVFLFGLTVGLLLTASRSGIAVSIVAVAVWLAFGGPRVEGAAALLLGGAAGLVVGLWALSRPGIADDAQAHSARVHDGAWFALVCVLAAVAVAAVAYLGSLTEERRPLLEQERLLVGRVALGALGIVAAAGVVVLIVAAKPQSWFHDFTRVPTNPAEASGAQRLTSFNSNSRWQWWKEAWKAFEKQPLRGTGAGSFELSHRLFRTNQVFVTEPHNVPLQFLSETGIVGFLLAVGSVAVTAVGVVQRVRGSPAGLALGVGALAYVLHSVVDFDWDFVAVTGPFLLSVGVLLGGRVVGRPRQWTLALVPAALALVAAYSLLSPWFASRASDSALAALEAGRPAQAVGHARDARSLNPFALEPVFLEAGAAEQLGDLSAARSLYVKAIDLQPLNWRPWYELGSFELDLLNYRAAVPALRRAVELDPQGTLAPGLLKQALAKLGR
jgi:O-antigen ligase/polysaccharide polymerase Wzy-like membrane protein/tetratricopeptide repeat protein